MGTGTDDVPGFPGFTRKANGSITLPEGTGGPGRLLVNLVAAGLDPEALPIAAALVVALDTEALDLAADRRARAARAAEIGRDAQREATRAFFDSLTPDERAARARHGSRSYWARLSPEERSERGRRSAQKRWANRRAA